MKTFLIALVVLPLFSIGCHTGGEQNFDGRLPPGKTVPRRVDANSETIQTAASDDSTMIVDVIEAFVGVFHSPNSKRLMAKTESP